MTRTGAAAAPDGYRSLGAAVAVVTVLALPGCGGQTAMTAADAREFARAALADAGLPGAEVAAEVTVDRCGGAIEAWRTTSRLPGGGTAEMCVARRGDRAVYVKDVGPGGVGPLLTEEQFARLEAFRHNPAAERRRRRVAGIAPVASVLVVALGVAIGRTVWRRPSQSGQ